MYRRCLVSRLLEQLASHPASFDTLQEFVDIILTLDTRYHERQKEKGGSQEKNPPLTGTHSLRPNQDSSSKKPHHRKNKRGKNFKVSKDKPHAVILNEENQLIGS
ncbi:hypothetical protein O181_071854 [Austropuccinia psidii MF-1]|uniref:Uncharacterized protein n=1 Tax=Austropuccinia psidii MF-1 TaxID=1389203 RepID=A0A9Q3F3K5_9BASI|nr:hypothetical protein [Austropuccinia psidii MF-1]